MASKSGQSTSQIDFNELVRLMACGGRQIEIARMLGVDVRRLRRFVERDQKRITEAVEAYRSELLASSAGKLADAMTDAVQTLKDLLNSKSEKIRLGASRSLIDSCLKVCELTRLEGRLSLLEQSLRSSGTGGNLA